MQKVEKELARKLNLSKIVKEKYCRLKFVLSLEVKKEQKKVP